MKLIKQSFLMISESWLKKRWKTIRNDHKRITIYNHIHNKKVPTHRLAKDLKFLIIDLNGANKMNFEDLKQPKSETFYVTEEMLDSCDIDDSVTIDSIVIPKVGSGVTTAINSNNASPESTKTNNIHVKPKKTDHQTPIRNTILSDSSRSGTQNAAVINPAIPGTDERCEDTIFGELVAAMLKKMSPEQKKQTKKEIMNILL